MRPSVQSGRLRVTGAYEGDVEAPADGGREVAVHEGDEAGSVAVRAVEEAIVDRLDDGVRPRQEGDDGAEAFRSEAAQARATGTCAISGARPRSRPQPAARRACHRSASASARSRPRPPRALSVAWRRSGSRVEASCTVTCRHSSSQVRKSCAVQPLSRHNRSARDQQRTVTGQWSTHGGQHTAVSKHSSQIPPVGPVRRYQPAHRTGGRGRVPGWRRHWRLGLWSI